MFNNFLTIFRLIVTSKVYLTNACLAEVLYFTPLNIVGCEHTLFKKEATELGGPPLLWRSSTHNTEKAVSLTCK